MLTASEGPFRLGFSSFPDLSKYRNGSIHYEYWLEDDDETQHGPILRSFKRGSPGYCPDVWSYSIKEFPLRELAVRHGISQYWALPICQLDGSPQLQHCFGVLECVAGTTSSSLVTAFDRIFNALTPLGLTCPGSHPNKCYKLDIQDKAETFKTLFADTTLDDVIQQCGKRLEDAAAALVVTGPTLTCVPNTSSEPVEGEFKESEIKCYPNINLAEQEAVAGNSVSTGTAKGTNIQRGNNETDDIYTMIVRATFKEDTVKFPISSDSGIEDLRRELDESFELIGEKFKIKYVEEGGWIMKARNKDLRYHMDTLRSSGKNVMNLSVFPSTL
ncbi:OLC1v1031898C1 [Oldenlandia corymbosa var. corymbosa]|uniref:OLC1v1031898C1 n=1 Tax=Oldenlandia corymbosa var. corymbosa TaxID=529605 RepID=A0AAV1CJH7_OLDCO|nr:OLC1v1031898C1 [Oldenlandia corymbosa var. corymbosa]